jgi:predicted amidohydrolase YtcJ
MRRFQALVLSLTIVVGACSGDSPAVETSTPATTTTTVAAVTTTAPEPTTTTTEPLPPVEPATLVLTGGSILTMDPERPRAEAVAVLGGGIAAVGSAEEIARYIGPDTQVVELQGRTVVPGFVDAHAHYFTITGGEPQAMRDIQDLILSTGTTTVADMSVGPELLAALLQLQADGDLRVHVSAYLLHMDACGSVLDPWITDVPPTRAWGERLRIGGVKLYGDGGACNAPASTFVKANGAMGDLYLTAEEITAVVSSYEAEGYQVVLHALGDRAVEAALDGMEAAIGDSGNPMRHRIDHNASVRPELRGRYDDVGAVAVTFGSLATCFLTGQDDRFQFSMPEEYQEWEWPWREMLDLNPNTVFAWHGDYPVFEDSSPIGSLAGYVTRRQILDNGTECEPEPYHLKHAITVEEALWIMTMGSAYALDRDTEVGSIQVDKFADLVVLPADPTRIAPNALFDLTVELTIFEGEVVHCGDAYAGLCG